MKKILFAIVSLVLAAGIAWAQPATPPSGWRIQSGSTRAQYPVMLRSYTVATLPTGVTNDLVLATDCESATACTTGGGTSLKMLVKTTTGWEIVGDGQAAGAGDVGSVGSCEDGACLDGTADGGEWVRLYDGDSHYVQLDVGDLSGNVTVNLPTTAGTLQLSALANGYVWVGSAGGVAEAIDSAGWDKDSSNDYVSGGTDVALADGGTGASLADPNADRLMFWDDSEGTMAWLTVGAGLTITAAEITATGSGDVTSIGGTGEGACTAGDCLDGTSDGGNFIRLYDGNSHYTQLAAGDSAGNLTFTFPTAAPGGNNATVVMSTAGVLSTVAQGQLPGITPAQGDVLYYNGTSWVALTAGVSGQYLQTQGAAANPQWASTAISGDIEYVGDVESGAAFTADGGGNTLWFEGATANAHEILLTGADPTDEDKTITLPAATGTVVLGPASFAADNILIKTNFAAGTVTLTQATGITVDDNNDMSGGRNLNITGDLTVQGDDITMGTNTIGAVLVGDGTNFNPVVMSGDVSIAADGATTIGNDKILTAHVNWGSEATQIDLDEVPDGTDFQKVAAADVDASGHVMRVYDSDGTGSITVTGPTDARAITIDDAAQELAARNRANTFTGNNTFGDGDTDTLTIRSMIIGGNSRAVQIAASVATPTYATGTNELYVAGDIETDGTVYAASLNTGTGTDGSRAITMTNNDTLEPTASGNKLYFYGNVFTVVEDGTAKAVVTYDKAVTWTGTTHSFAGVTNVVLPTAAPDAAGEIGINTTNNQLIWHDGAAVVKLDTTTLADGKILKYSAANAQFQLEDDATGSSPTLNSVGDPTDDTTIAMDLGEEVNFDYTGSFTTGSQFKIEQKTPGDPTGGVLFEVKAADANVTLAKFGDGTNYLQISQTGNVSHGGTSVFTAPRVTTTIAPSANDGAALGTTALMWSDLFIASGGVLNFNNGDVTLTHGSNVLTLGGGDLALGANNLTMTGSLGATGARLTKVWAEAAEFTALPTVGGNTISPTNVTPVDTADESAAFYPLLVDGATGTQATETDGELSYNPSTDLLTVANASLSGYIALGSDPADAGAIRLSNAQYIYAEADAAGTDISVIGVDSSEVVQIAASGASGVTITPDTTVTGDLTVTGADITLAAAGVKLTGSNGSLTILGLGDGQDEDLKIDLNTTANTIEITSPASSATAVDFNTLNLITTGSIQGAIKINSDADGMSSAEMTAVGLYGTAFFATGAGTWALPGAAAGMSFCVYSTTAAAIVINPDDGDAIVLNGTALSAGDSITSASGAGDFVCLVALDANTWYTMGRSGTWTDTN